jgi:hypothetical protein
MPRRSGASGVHCRTAGHHSAGKLSTSQCLESKLCLASIAHQVVDYFKSPIEPRLGRQGHGERGLLRPKPSRRRRDA